MNWLFASNWYIMWCFYQAINRLTMYIILDIQIYCVRITVYIRIQILGTPRSTPWLIIDTKMRVHQSITDCSVNATIIAYVRIVALVLSSWNEMWNSKYGLNWTKPMLDTIAVIWLVHLILMLVEGICQWQWKR